MADQAETDYLSQNKGPWLYAIFLTLLGLSLIIIGLRLYCRVRYIKLLQWSDYILIVAMVTTCGMSAMIHMQIQTGMGRHIEYSKSMPGMLVESMKVGYAENILYQVTLGLVKCSILAQYHFIARSPVQKRVVVGIASFIVVWTVFVTLAAILQCIPVSNIFNPDVFPKGCWNMQNMNLATSSINIALDIVIFVIPLPILTKLNMKRRKKLILLATYFFGSLSIVASALRVSSMVLWNGEPDFTYVSAIIPVYDAVEINTGIICACIPLLRPLIKRILSHTRRAPLSFSGSNSNPRPTWIRTHSVPSVMDEVPLGRKTSAGKDEEAVVVQMEHVRGGGGGGGGHVRGGVNGNGSGSSRGVGDGIGLRGVGDRDSGGTEMWLQHSMVLDRRSGDLD